MALPTTTPLSHLAPQLGPRIPSHGDASAVTGSWHGNAVAVAPSRDKAVHNSGSANTSLLTGRALAKQLSQRSIRRAAALQPMRLNQIQWAARLNGSPTSIRQMATDILRSGRIPPPQSGRRATMQSYIALQSAARYLDDDGESDDVVALLAPIAGLPGSSQELADMLQQSGDDRGAMAELLQDVDGLPDDPEELYEALKDLRYDPPALAKYLREVQGLPTKSDAMRRLRQQVQDAVRELERTQGGVIRASLNAGQVAEHQADPAGFLDAYSDLVHGAESFATTFKNLLERFGAENLREALETMKKALGDDLNAALPSSDPARLRVILGDLAHMHISSTLLEMVDRMISRLERMQSLPHAAGAAPARPLDTTALLSGMVSIVSAAWVAAVQFESLARDLGFDDGQPMIQFLTGGRAVMAELPERIYQSDDARRAVLSAAQDALDAAIDREEALLEEGGYEASGGAP